MVWHPVSHTHTQNEVNPGKRFLGKEEERKKERKKEASKQENKRKETFSDDGEGGSSV